jgi:hypothetical protein
VVSNANPFPPPNLKKSKKSHINLAPERYKPEGSFLKNCVVLFTIKKIIE